MLGFWQAWPYISMLTIIVLMIIVSWKNLEGPFISTITTEVLYSRSWKAKMLILQIESQLVDSEGSGVAPNHNQGKSAKLVWLNINRKVRTARKYSFFFSYEGALTSQLPFPILGVIHWIFFHKFHNHCIFLSFFLNCVGMGTSEVHFFKCMYIALYCVWYCMVLHDIDIAWYFMVAYIL